MPLLGLLQFIWYFPTVYVGEGRGRWWIKLANEKISPKPKGRFSISQLVWHEALKNSVKTDTRSLKLFSSLDRLYTKNKSCLILTSVHLNLFYKEKFSLLCKKFDLAVVKDFSRLYFIAAI